MQQESNTMSLQMPQHDTSTSDMMYETYNRALHLQLQQQKEKDRRALYLNNRACVMVLSKRDYSEANKLFDSALMIHKEQSEEVKTSSLTMETPQQHECFEGCDSSHTYETEFSDDLEEFDDFGEMDWDNNKDRNPNTSIDSHFIQSQHQSEDEKAIREPAQTGDKISRMTSFSKLQSVSYSGQQEYHEEKYGRSKPQHHQVYSLPIVMEETEWETAPVQDKSFVLIFNTALCNHLWGMQLMQQYLEACANGNGGVPSAAMAQHCRETLTVSKLLYKLALENSVSFANGVDKMCYVALYNNLSHVCKTLEGYESLEAQWCDDMLLKAIFWWRDSSQHQQQNQFSLPRNTASNDLYLDDDLEIVDAFFDNVYYRIGVPEEIAPAAAA